MKHTTRFPIYLLPPLRSSRHGDLRILFLADGNNRAESAGGGYGAGARNVVALAEHLAARPDVSLMVACILSPDNITKRGQPFFTKVRDQFVRLGDAIAMEGVLVGAGVRLEICGDLRRLRERGGPAAELAGVIEAVVRSTELVSSPRLRLAFGVDYGEWTPVGLDVDVVIRTGMEAESVLRLSGLSSYPGILNVGTTKLWPELGPADVDDAIEAAKSRVQKVLLPGHPASLVVEIVEALSRRSASTPVSLTLPTTAAPATLCEAIERLYERAPEARGAVAVCVHTTSVVGEQWYGRPDEAPHEVHVVWSTGDENVNGSRGFDSILAPGQVVSALIVPERPPLGNANVHACGTSAAEIVEGVFGAVQFSVEYPPLLGADRAPETAAVAVANDGALEDDRPDVAPCYLHGAQGVWPPEIAGWMRLFEQRPGRSIEDLVRASRQGGRGPSPDVHTLADMFTAKSLCWARGAGLLLPGEGSLRATANYALTAFFIHHAGGGAVEAAWEPAADLSATCMMAVAAGDDGIFDGVFEGEGREARQQRLEASARFLQAVVAGDASAEAPAVNGAPLLAAIGAEWRRTLVRYGGFTHPIIVAGWQRSLHDLYQASVNEYAEALVENPLVSRLAAGGMMGRAAAHEIEQRYAATAPRVVADRIDVLLRAPVADGEPRARAITELRLILYLCDMASSMGAGLLFRAGALRTPADQVTDGRARTLDAAATLLDFAFRLENDVSSFTGWAEGERDLKTGACAAIIGRDVPGPQRAAAVSRALAVCHDVGTWLRRELAIAIEELEAEWPVMATAVRRGAFVGHRVYQIGHYETVTRDRMREVYEELEAYMNARLARRSGGQFDESAAESLRGQLIAC
ncbi:MAG: hypothetical protein QM820_60570 [Minicystis sp.]